LIAGAVLYAVPIAPLAFFAWAMLCDIGCSTVSLRLWAQTAAMIAFWPATIALALLFKP
jgi:hypothetical protein